MKEQSICSQTECVTKDSSCGQINMLLGNSFFHSDEQPELNLENDYPNKTGFNLKKISSISIL